MKTRNVSRRQFLQKSLAAAGALSLASSPFLTGCAGAPVKRTATDQVTLGKTGIKLSRLGMGCGSNSGQIQHDLGQQGFNDLVRYAYDQGITYFDCAQTYRTFEWMGDAIKPFPREKIFLQSKVPGKPNDILAAIDHHRKIYNTDYIDSLLIHCMIEDGWTDQWARIMDGFNEAKGKGWIRAKGVSCHSLPALRLATASPWTEVHLVRVNPQGAHTDAEQQSIWSNDRHDVSPVLAATSRKCTPTVVASLA